MVAAEDLWDPERERFRALASKYDYLLPPVSEALQARIQSAVSDPPPPRNGREYQGPPEMTSGPWRPLSEEQAKSKAVGALVGMAVGDALGTTLEFQRRDANRIDDMIGGGPFQLQPGEWTDDTSMALCLADSLLAVGRFEARDYATRLSAWYRDGKNSVNGRCFDIGITTRTALDRFIATNRTGGVPNGFRSAGNAGLVRGAPTTIFCRHRFARAWTFAEAQCRVTHGAVEAISATRFFASRLWDLLNGATKEEALSPRVLPVTDRVMLINAGEYKSKTRDQISSSGFVIDTLEAALWSVWTTDNFEDAVLTAANLADDADSVAAAAGQLAGALYSIDAIPERWRARLAWHDHIQGLAVKLFEAAPVS
jgi:ADP-ribosyl-[dinitrogen reductase] hydrolase